MSFSAPNKNLPRAILEVLSYFDLFAYPLTALEIWMNLQTRASYEDVLETLQKDKWLRTRLTSQNGMWMLKKGNAPLGERPIRYRASVGKLKKARKFARLLRVVPGIQGVFACNALGYLHTKSEGDIDLFIIARRGRIWLSRLWAVLCAELIGGRPKRAHAKDGLCLSFFAIEGAYLERLAIADDVYYSYWLSKLAPIFVRGEAAERLWERNVLVHRAFPQMQPMHTPAPYLVEAAAHRSRKTILWEIGNLFERVARAFQLKIMPAYLKDAANSGTAVVVSDEFLKFHDHDRRAYFKEEFERRVAEVA